MRTRFAAAASLLLLLGATARADDPCPPKPPPACPPAAPVAPAPPAAQPPAKPEPEPPAQPTPEKTEKPAEDEATVRARSATVRAALPAPLKPWTFERDLVFDGYLLGKVTITAEPATLEEKPVWYVAERTVREAGEGRVVSESSCFLAQDLSLIRGETMLRAPEGTEAMSFGRRDGKMEVTAEEGGKTRSAMADVPPDATLGLFSLIQFVEGAFAQAGASKHRLPMFDPRHAFGDGEGKPLPAGLADCELTPRFGGPDGLHIESKTRSGRAALIWLADGRVRDIKGQFPKWDLAASAREARRPDWFDRVGQTPQTAYQAFCNFGRGYHMAKRELIESAFDWPSVHAHDLAVGSIKADMTVEQLKEAYIAEFLARSKHRTAADCDDLITQIFVTGEITKAEDGTVSIKAHPAYGGHTFHIVRKDERWWIARID